MQIIAVDWSGRAKGPAESLWRAEVRQGRLTELRNGLGRGELIAKLLELGEAEPRMVIGLDFAFSFPAWWCEENGWSSGEDVEDLAAPMTPARPLGQVRWGKKWGKAPHRFQPIST